MAVTKIWPIKNSFAAPIIYVQNSEKTLNPNAGMSEESLQALEDVIAKIQVVQQELIATERWQRNNAEILENYTGWQAVP